ncbi:MAG: hypothetical protein IPP90_00650 [Gemmatimonadaceae bacterium]|nr:hypothetical protein [Gemmatimonadaceae bacterium]
MLASKLLNAIDRVLESAEVCGPAAQVDDMVRALKAVRLDLYAAMEDIDRASDDVRRLRAMQHWNERAEWAEQLVSTMYSMLKQPMPI